MPRPLSAHTRRVKTELVSRLRGGFYAPGQRFLSNRAIAEHHGVSYQTAHRLVNELCREGLLQRRPSSGTYVNGPARALKGVELFFHPRAQREGSFGARLLAELRAVLADAGVNHRVRWAADGELPAPNWLPVIWEHPAAVQAMAAERRFVVLLNDRPPAGLAANYVDSVSTDDFSGGAAAGEILREFAPPRKLLVFAGPRQDLRSQARVSGFQTRATKAAVVWCSSWYAEDAVRFAPRVLAAAPSGIFCANDRLAEALLRAYAEAKRPRPPILGFDDAPIARQLELSSIAVPWSELVQAAAGIISRRLAGDTGATAQLIFSPRPVFRASAPCE